MCQYEILAWKTQQESEEHGVLLNVLESVQHRAGDDR